MALRLFHEMAKRVPAYKKFLDAHDINVRSIKTISDFKKLPMLDKDNYLRKYSKSELCWDGVFKDTSWVISSTSGSSGEPFYFPRQDLQDHRYATTAELYLRNNFKIHERSTLYVNAFAMGVWIGGIFTYEAVKQVAQKGYRLSIITPGINKTETIKAIQRLGPDFDQVIIGSYPPILKDILDDGIRAGLDWNDYNLGIIFSAEGFSEDFRDYVIKKAGLKNEYLSTLNHYGTVDLGTMSHETPLSVMARRIAVKDTKLQEAVFGQLDKLPTLTQFLPEAFYFEDDDGKLLCSSYSGIPLVRYDLKDQGGILSLSQLKDTFSSFHIDLDQEAASVGIDNTTWNLPFVHVYERSDFSVSFLGFQIYPEPVRKALNLPQFHERLTGKFSMIVDYDKKAEQYLQIHVELKAGTKETEQLSKQTREAIKSMLIQHNPIYKMNQETLGDRVLPIITFWGYEDPAHFGGGGKQKWIKK